MKILVHPKDEQTLELLKESLGDVEIEIIDRIKFEADKEQLLLKLKDITVVVPTLPEEILLPVARKQTVFQIARRAAAVRGQTTSKAYVRNMLMRGRK